MTTLREANRVKPLTFEKEKGGHFIVHCCIHIVWNSFPLIRNKLWIILEQRWVSVCPSLIAFKKVNHPHWMSSSCIHIARQAVPTIGDEFRVTNERPIGCQLPVVFSCANMKYAHICVVFPVHYPYVKCNDAVSMAEMRQRRTAGTQTARTTTAGHSSRLGCDVSLGENCRAFIFRVKQCKQRILTQEKHCAI